MSMSSHRTACVHGMARPDARCVLCGAITRSHSVLGAEGDPVTKLIRMQCPGCGNLVAVRMRAMLCHKCHEKDALPLPDELHEPSVAAASPIGHEG